MLLARFLFVVMFFCLPLQAAVVAEPFPPARFTSLYVEWDQKDGVTTVELNGDSLIYKVVQGGKVIETKTTHPSADDWFQFIQALNAAKVFKWTPKYYYPGQGSSWVVDLVMDDRKFGSEGTNDFPLNGDESKSQTDPKAGPSIPFQLFWQAVLTLAGKAPVPVTQCPGKGPTSPPPK